MERVRGDRRRRIVAVGGALAALGAAAVLVALLIAGGHTPRTAAKSGPLESNEASSSLDASATTSAVPVEVPVLVGLPVGESELLLKAAGLVVRLVSTPPGDAVPGTVFAQTPAPGERVATGTVVELVYADANTAADAASAAVEAPSGTPASGLVVCIDPGHQASGNSALEPVGPGSAESKPKVTSGATGVVTRQPEHETVLALSLKIKERLERYGVTVVMTRTTAAVDISNSQRAAVANEAAADLFLRVHADSSTNADIRGISTLYPAGNSWVEPISGESLKAAGIVHKQILASSGASDRGVVKRADLSGFNYATVPSILVETGFLSNPVDDRQLADGSYQDQLADGIARGVLEYLGVGQD